VATAGLDDFTFHGCRHHFASWFMMRGGQLESLRQILGHKDLKMTLRYAHLSPGHLRAEMNKTASGAGNGTKTAHEPILDLARGDGAAQVVEVADAGGYAPVAQLDRATVS
jgi:Phage integrase family